MSTKPGNDPFSGTNTRDLLQHIISPKVVTDGSTGYAVKADLVNIDQIYTKGLIRAGLDGAGDVQTPSAFAITDPTFTTTNGRISADATNLYIQGNTNIKLGKVGQSTTNTTLVLGTGGSNNDTLQVGGSIRCTNVLGISDPTNFSNPYLQISASSPTVTFFQTANMFAFGQLGQGTTSTQLTIGAVGGAADLLSVSGTITARQDSGALGTNHYKLSNKAGTNRWGVGMNDLETGSNVGGNYSIYAYDDIGTFINKPFYITRSTGIVNTPIGFYGKNKGTATLVGGTLTVNNANVTDDSDILLTIKTLGGTGTGNAYVSAKVASTSFTITSVAGAGDTSTFNYIILN